LGFLALNKWGCGGGVYWRFYRIRHANGLLMATSVTKGGTQKLPQTFKIVDTYWHDHSLESSSTSPYDRQTY
jgi:hypothetical protein